MLPDKTIKCHRTGFTKTCHECVTQHGCRLWKRVTLEGDPSTPPGHAVKPVDHWDCADSLYDLYMRDSLRRQLQITASVDALRQEVQKANDGLMVDAILRLNERSEPQLLEAPAGRPKLLKQ